MSIVDDFTRELGDDHWEYLRDISPMAPSMKTLGLLLELCTDGCRVADLGSGFSSYTLRYYANRLRMTIHTIDDNNAWLEKTKHYCKDVGTEYNHNFSTWDFITRAAGDNPYDVVFLDLGTTRRRPQYYSTILEKFCDERTLILFDDMHKRPLRDAVSIALRRYDYIEIPVKDRTIDEFGRYCRLIFRLRPKENANVG